MNLQPICHSFRAAVLVGATALAGCGSDPGSSAFPLPTPPEELGSPNDPPPRPQTKEACDACGGLWAVHGILPTESCICATRDAGERCIDGGQCVGQCLLSEDAEFHVMEDVEPPRGFFVGTCSPYDTTFGCHRVIPTGTDEMLPLPADEASARLCID
jgi:hypothetical protein